METILCRILLVFGIAGWSSLFAYTGIQYGNQHLSGVFQFWMRSGNVELSSDDGNSTNQSACQMHQVRLRLDGDIIPGYLGYRVEAECLFSAMITDVSIRWWAARGLEVKFGRFAPNFLLYGAASVDSLEAPYSPLIVDFMGLERQVGFEITQKSRYVQICAGFFNQAYYYDDINEVHNVNNSVLIRTDITLFDFTRLVFNGIYGREEYASHPNLEYFMAGVALKVDWEQLVFLRMELVGGWRESYINSNYDEPSQLASEGILLHLGYRFTPKLEARIRYEWYDGDLDSSEVGRFDYSLCLHERTMLGVSYYFIPNRFLVNGYYLHHFRDLRNNWFYQYYNMWYNSEEVILELQLSF